jgi:hypothetical protein
MTNTIETTPILLASAFGISDGGKHRCYYCGAKCSGEISAADWVKDSFTSRDTVFGGGYVCVGCTIALNESADIAMIDGERRSGQKTRCYSWVITPEKAFAATKAHRAELLRVCLDPPLPPYSIVISDSGQKHLLYRGVVCHTADACVATIEGDRVSYTRDELSARVVLAKKLIAASGKPALADPFTANTGMRIAAHHGDDAIVNLWDVVREESLSRLALWLAPPKEECLNEYPAVG